MVALIVQDDARRKRLMSIAQEKNEELFKKFPDTREVYLIAAYQAQQCFLQMVDNGNPNEAAQLFEGFYNDTKNMMRRLAMKKDMKVN